MLQVMRPHKNTVMGKAEKIVEQKAYEKHEADEEQKGDDHAEDKQVVVPISTTQKERPSLLQSTSNHSVSSNFGNQFINSPNVSFIGTIPENADAEINSLLDIQIQQDVPHIQQEPFHVVKVFTELEQAVKELKQADPSTVILASIKSQVLSVVKDYLGSSLPDAFQKAVKEALRNKEKWGFFEPNLMSIPFLRKVGVRSGRRMGLYDVRDGSSWIKIYVHLAGGSNQDQSTIQADESLSEYELKKILYEKMHKSQSNLTHVTHQELFDALTWSMLLDEANKEKGDKLDSVPKKRDRGDDQDKDPLAGSNQGKKTQKRRFNESESSKKTSIAKELSKGKSLAKTSKSGKSVTAEEPPWFNEMVQAEKPSLTFDELMSTPIDFSAFAMNRLKLDKITKELLVGPVFNLLKGTCKSCGELEYNMEECYRALTDQLYWANPEGHKSLIDMCKPLPLQDKDGQLVIPVEFFFNNELEYLKAGSKERTYSSSITKTPATRMLLLEYLTVEKRSRYGYLKEIIVRRVDKELYKFKGGDFSDLHLNDIEDMLQLIAQNKLYNLDGDMIVDFVTALKMLLNFKFGYNKDIPLRKWTPKDEKQTGIMVNKIDDRLFKRWILRSLEVLVGGRKTKKDK
ncbi:hypothetical protein Tco_1447412 [Tanacetum coccineum]